MEKRELTCIGCPMGCHITVTLDGKEITDIAGYTCKRGLEYARTEVTAPVRSNTSTVRVLGGKKAVVPVKTASPIPKEKIDDCMKEIYKITVNAPVAIGDVLCDNICGTGVALIASGCA